MHDTYSRLLTTGFVLREDTPGVILADDFVDKHNLGFNVYRVEGFKDLYIKHISDPSHENYMALVDIVNSTIGRLSVEEFFIKGQANNSTITPLSICFIEDILSGSYMSKHARYSIATSGLKICILANLNNGLKLEKQFKTAWNVGDKKSMSRILSELIAEKELFISFLRYVFID